MIDIIAAIAVIGLVASNLFLVYIVWKTKLLEKSKDLFEYKAATKEVKVPTPPNPEDPIQVELY